MPADVQKMLEVAGRAPSSHNTQPWNVVPGNSSVTVGYDPERQLLVGDPHKRELFMSLGCYLESFLLAAADQGYQTTLRYLGDSPNGVVQIALTPAAPKNGHWSQLIEQRRSDRRFYDDRPIGPELLDKLSRISYEGSVVKLFSQPKDIEFLASATAEATLSLMTPPAFREELAHWVRNNWTRQPDGMPGYSQGMPGPVSLLANLVIRKNPAVARQQAAKDAERVRRSAAIALVCAPNEDYQTWIAAGRTYQQLCLRALEAGIQSSAISAAVIDPTTVEKISRQFKLPATPVALIRLGYREGTVRATPRRHLF